MSSNTALPVRHFIPAALFLSITSWSGVAFLFFSTYPTVGPRWLFFFLIVTALAGTTLPIVAFINRRFPSQPPASAGIVIRQSTWIGLFGATVVWLQIGRVLTYLMVILLLIGFALVEFLLRLGERSQWNPTADPSTETNPDE